MALYTAFHLPNPSIPHYASFDHMVEAAARVVISSCGSGIGSRDQLADRHNWFVHRELGTVGCMALYFPDGWTAHGGDIGDVKNPLTSCEHV